MNRISCFSILVLLLFHQLSFSQIVDPFSIRYQNQQKGGIVMLANVSVSCTNCATVTSQVPPSGTGQNNNVTMNYVDSDSDPTTFMSSSDSLNLANCSEVLWAGLYWTGRVTSTTFNYSLRNQIKLKIGTGAYQNLTADELLDNTVGHETYHCFKNITNLVQSNGIKSRYVVADLITRTATTAMYGGWTIVVVYKNVYQSMRNLTVFDGLANVSSGNTVTIPISGFLTPIVGPVNFELGVVSHDGDRSQTGDQLQFNGVGTSYVNVSDALHNTNDAFNSTISRNGVLTPFRTPSFNNNLGHDASVFFPNNTALNYIGNNASSANIRITTGGETILTTVVTSVIDVYEPDLRATVYMQDLNGGTVNPGDVLEYTLVGKNIGSDISTGTYMTDTLDVRTTYLPGSISVFYGPNSGLKTDAYLDDQAEYDPVNRVVRVRIGNGANATTGGTVASSSTGLDSTVVKFRVTLVNDCVAFQCDPTLEHKAYIFGSGNISGNAYNNGGLSDLIDANGCPTIANDILSVNVTGCPPINITTNPPVCVGDLLTLSAPSSFGGIYSWTGPNAYSSSGQSSISIPNVTSANAGQYALSINFPSLNCTLDTTKIVTILPNPTIQLASSSNVSCFGGNNGALAITNTGTAPYSYLWTNGSISTNPTGLIAGSYTVTVTDANTCFKTATYTITQPTALTGVTTAISDFNGFDVSCFGSTNGMANVVASGGTPVYTYLWSNGSTSATTAANLPAGNASVTIFDANLCSIAIPVTLIQPTDLISSSTKTDVSCFAGSNGTIDLSASGGVQPYSYAWSNTQTTQDLSSLTSGTYSVTVTDLNNCQELLNVTVLQPSAPLTLTKTHQNVLCFNQLTGSIDLTPSGGTAPYSYLWSNGATTQDLSGLGAGNYTVTVTDAKLCTANLTVTITQPAQAISATTAIINVACFGFTTGSIDLTVSGGVSPYTYLWSNGAITADLVNIGAANYGVTITDVNSCALVLTNLIITQPPSAVQTTVSSINVACFSGSTGSIDITPSGGVSPYTYLWSNGAITQDLTNLTAATYNLVTTDFNGCTKLNTVVITQPLAPLTLAQTHFNVLCFNQLTGSVDLTPTGGTAPYSYLWSNGAITQDLSGLGAGNYTVTVTDVKLCTANLTVTITQPAQALSALSTLTNVTCFGLTTGAIDITVSGGASPYTYLWSNGAITADLVNIGAANYSVTITDVNSCTIALTNLIITQPSSAVQTTVASTNVACFSGSTGSIDITPTGGISPYTYSWSNGAITQDLINLSAGTYNLVTTDINGCTKLNSVVISQPLAPFTLSKTHLNVLCFNQLTGSIDLTASGGTAPYSYSWSNGSTTQDLSGLGAGNFTVIATDANLCTANLLVTITQPTQAISLTSTITNVACYQESTGSIDLSVLGGTAPYTYSWSNGSINQDLSNVPANTYSVIVTDVNGCSASISNLIITQPSVPLMVSFFQWDVSCYGGSNGQIGTAATGGTAPYTYLWSTGQTTSFLNNLQAGNYTLTTTDSKGCSFTYVSFVTQPPVSLTSSESHVNILCYGAQTGSINVSPSGGTLPYTYLWSNGAVTQDLSGIASGTYSVLITDYNLCTSNISVTIAQPLLPITPTTAITNVLCFGQNNGAINLSVVGGTSPYTYLWNNGVVLQDLNNYPANNYSVTITDAAGCISTLPNLAITQPAMPLALNLVGDDINCFAGNDGSITTNITGGTAPYIFQWSNSATTQNLTGLAAGSYSVLITDAYNCTISASISLTQPIAPLVVTETHVDVLCFGLSTGSANTTVTGGTLPYSYSWNSGQSTEDLSNIVSGNYVLTVTDAQLCLASVTSAVTQPNTPLALTETHLDAVCLGGIQGSIDLTVTGGTAPYLYSWNNGSNAQDQPNLFAGFYESSVVDANGCSDTIGITILDPTNSLIVTESITDVICFGGSTGLINLTSSGGTPSYDYSWSTGAATEDVSGLVAGNYFVTVSDANSCGVFLNLTVLETPTPIVVSSVISNVLCIGDMNGSIDASVSGGISPYTYSWTNGSVTQDVSAIGAGNYGLTVTDNIGCVSAYSATVLQMSQVVINETHNNVACFGENSGSINVTPVGGIPNLTYLWSNGETTQDLFLLAPGTYSLSLTDGLGCVTPLSVLITQPAAPLLIMNSITNVSCFGNSNGMLDITVSGGTVPYVYTWNNGTSTQDQIGIVAGVYLLNVTDVNGCEILDSYTITQPSLLDVTYTSVNVNCFGGNNGSINLSVTGGEIPYSYSWSNGAIVQDINTLIAGVYTITVTDAYNCQQIIPITIAQPLAPLSATETHLNIACFGQSTGAIDLIPVGGTFPYTYDWSNGATLEDLTGLPIGNYSVLVTDIQGCTTSIATTLTQPNSPLVFSNALTDVLCFSDSTGAISITTSGGALPYSYVWSNGAVTEDLNNINAGVYTFNLTDAGGCQILDTFTINQPTLLDVSLVSSNVSCFGGNNGDIDISVIGGITPYVYAWSNGESTQDISQLFPGIYSLLVTDANNCTKTASALITEPALPLTAVETHVNILCFGNATGSIDITPNGGTPSYTYSWSNGATTQDLTNVVAGNYNLIITDSLGCTFNISVTLTQPLAPVSIASSVFNVSCFGGSNGRIDVAFNGGTAPYTFVWSNGATTQNLTNLTAGAYTITVTDQHGCVLIETYTITQPNPLQITWVVDNVNCFAGNDGAIDLTILGGTAPYTYIWSNSPLTQDASGLIAGTYSVLVTDAKGCFADSTINVTQPAAPLSISENHVNVLCYGDLTGSINVTVAGGTPSYDYLWSNGSISEDLINVAAGFYSVAVTDSLGCTISISATITEPAAPLFISNTTTNVSCFGGSDGILDITVSGGTTPYAYLWSNTSVSQDLANLVSGLYTITVTDSNACVISQTYNVTQPLLPLSSAVNMSPVICFDDATGAAFAFANGGTAPYDFLWSNGVTADSNVNIVADLYYVIVTDTNGCTSTSFITVTEPPLLELQISGVDVLCNGDSTGSVSVSATGGVGFYQYVWDTNDSTSTVNNLPAGYYNVVVTDDNGCQAADSITILQPLNPISATFNVTNNLCFGESNGAINATIAGGVLPYDIDWSNGAITEDLANLIIGDYTLIITDSNNCVLTSLVTIDEPDLIEIENPILENISCNDFVDGSINLTTIGGVGQYTYNWSNGAQTEDLNNIISGSYFVVVEDGNNCIQIFEYTLTQPDTINTTYTLLEPSCFAYIDGEINTTTIGGTAPYVLNWSNNASTSSIQVGAGNYTLEITDANGCFHETQITLGQPEQIQVTLDADVFVGCDPLEVNFANNSDEQFLSNWYFGDASIGSGTQISHTYSGAGSYDVTLVITDANGCSNFADFPNLIDVLPTPVAGINVSTVYLNAAEPEAIILNTSEGATSYVWNLGDSPTDYTFYEPGNYTYPVYNQDEYLVTLVAIGSNGCTDSTQVVIEFDNRLIIYVPNSFTPNGDELNNVFKPIVPVPVKSYHFQIYNRWGELIFETFDKEEGWDGKFNGQLVQDGTYTWEISIVTSKADLFINTGNVNLFR